jgi:hypothetical protein
MSTEEILLSKWRNLNPVKQREVLAFCGGTHPERNRLTQPNQKNDSPLGQKLRAIRAQIVKSGIPLLDDRELEREIAERRGDREVIS